MRSEKLPYQVAEESTCAEVIAKRRWRQWEGTVPGLRPDCTNGESQQVVPGEVVKI